MKSFYNNYISVYAVLENTDIIVGQNQVLEIDINDVNITINVS